jgi:hypothetical protein
MANCPSCGHQVTDTARFCTRCGGPMMQPASSPEDVATRRLIVDEKTTGRSLGDATRPVYAPPQSPLAYPPTNPPPAAHGSATVDLGKWLSEGWQIYRQEPFTFSVAALLTFLLSLVTLTFLTGPLLAGFYHMVFKSMRGEKPAVGDLFKGMDRFWPAVFAWVIFAVIMSVLGGPSYTFTADHASATSPILGLLSLALMPLVSAIYFFVYPLIMERQRDTATALDEAARVVFPKNIVMFWVCGLIFHILGLAGLLGCGIGVLITTPFVLCAAAVAYRDFFGLAGPWSRESWPPPWMDQERNHD